MYHSEKLLEWGDKFKMFSLELTFWGLTTLGTKVGVISYLIWSLIVLLIAYILPYAITSLGNSSGIELYAFWALLALLHVIVTFMYMLRSWR